MFLLSKKASFADVMKATRTAIFNLVVMNLVMFYLVVGQLMRNAGCDVSVDTVPTWWRIILELAVCSMVQEFAFYYLHR